MSNCDNEMKKIMIFKLFIKGIIRFLLRMFYVFEVKTDRVFFESHGGNKIHCNPWIIYEYLDKVAGNGIEFVWSAKSRNRFEGKRAKFVRPRSLGYFRYVLTAKVYVTNIGGYGWIPFRKDQIVVNTWHGGGAYKKIETDFYDFGKFQWLYERSILAESKATTYFLSSSEATTDCMSSAWRLPKSKFFKSGLPRNDVFFHPQQMRDRSEYTRWKLNIGESDFVILYAPTYRNTTANPTFDWRLKTEFLFQAVENRFATKRTKLLFRLHPNFLRHPDIIQRIKAHETVSDIMDVSLYSEMQDLLCTADMLITDYSSSVWDYSFTYRPCFLFTPDLEEYKAETDFYTPIEEWGFPVCKTNETLREAIETFDRNAFKQAMIRHHENLGSYERGTATEEVGKMILSHVWC